MRIKWIRGGLHVPVIGMTREGVITDVPLAEAESLISQGIAEKAEEIGGEDDNSKTWVNSLSRDELVAELIKKGVDPPDKANKTELKNLLRGG